MSCKFRMVKLGEASTVILNKGVGLFMIYVGIDIAKKNHFASIITSEGEILSPTFSFSNCSDYIQNQQDF